jgi:alkylation response protein AidB-like acyl-CoA dehydrogenase
VRAEIAEPSRIDRAVGDGPLRAARAKCDRANRATIFGIARGAEKYLEQIAEKQELLGGLADCLILTYAMDSAITRAVQLAEAGDPGATIATAMAQLFVAQAHERVFDLVREMLMWMEQGEEWERGVAEVNLYYELSRVNTFSLRRQVARHMIDRGEYRLA